MPREDTATTRAPSAATSAGHSRATSVGYTSESAFSNAFKRTLGVAPRRYYREGAARS